MNDTKPWWQSKTIWLNTIVAVIALLDTMRDQVLATAGNHWGTMIVLAVAVVNVALRTVTTQGVAKQ